MTRIRVPTVAQVEKAINMSADEWVANCYAIACMMVDAGVVTGRPVFGHWLGRIAPGTPFYQRGSRIPFTQHGWVLHDPETRSVFDPTRWVFEGVEPYIYFGSPNTSVDPWPYDEGGNVLRAAMLQPFPKPDPSEPRWGVPNQRLRLPRTLVRQFELPELLTLTQVHWIAILPYDVLEPHGVEAIYRAIERSGHAPLIPIDNRRRASADSARSHPRGGVRRRDGAVAHRKRA